MERVPSDRTKEEVQRNLRVLFNAAAAMSLAVIDRLDAEAEMERFLGAVKAHPEERSFVVGLFLESFSDSFIMRHAPSDLVMYCMSDLRWPEIRQFIQNERDKDIKQHGIPCYGIWADILESFQDGWREKYFRDFTKRANVCERPT
jgi:hypothetical protein